MRERSTAVAKPGGYHVGWGGKDFDGRCPKSREINNEDHGSKISGARSQDKDLGEEARSWGGKISGARSQNKDLGEEARSRGARYRGARSWGQDLGGARSRRDKISGGGGQDLLSKISGAGSQEQDLGSFEFIRQVFQEKRI